MEKGRGKKVRKQTSTNVRPLATAVTGQAGLYGCIWGRGGVGLGPASLLGATRRVRDGRASERARGEGEPEERWWTGLGGCGRVCLVVMGGMAAPRPPQARWPVQVLL